MHLCCLLFAVALASPAWGQNTEPSFDCSKSASDAETAVCENANLARLDRELSRLYSLALDGPHISEAGAANLKALQRGWIKGRDDCWKAGDALEACVLASYAMRIDELRTGYADTRDDDDNGISRGPLAYSCAGLDALVSAVFINADPAVVSLRWAHAIVALSQTPAASGAKFATATPSGVTTFWTRGDEALLELPNEGTLPCRREPKG